MSIKLILLLPLCMFQIITKGQNITLDQVINLRTKSLAEVEEFLVSKNWEMVQAKEPSDSTLGMATFSYDKSGYNNKAASFVRYLYNNATSNLNRISIQINKTSIYSSFLVRLKALGFKLTSSKVKDGAIVKLYKDKSLTIEITNATQQENYVTKTAYQFFICNSFDYYIQFGKDNDDK